MKTALFIGRFQPFHKGHLSVIKNALKKVGLLYIGIGSALESYQPANPFTAAERMQMIEAALTEAEIPLSKIRIIPIPDINHYPAWPQHVRTLVPPFDTVVTGSEIVRELFEKFDHAPVENVKFEHKISSTKIREKLLEKKTIKNDVPKSVLALLKIWKAAERIKRIKVTSR